MQLHFVYIYLYWKYHTPVIVQYVVEAVVVQGEAGSWYCVGLCVSIHLVKLFYKGNC